MSLSSNERFELVLLLTDEAKHAKTQALEKHYGDTHVQVWCQYQIYLRANSTSRIVLLNNSHKTTLYKFLNHQEKFTEVNHNTKATKHCTMTNHLHNPQFLHLQYIARHLLQLALVSIQYAVISVHRYLHTDSDSLAKGIFSWSNCFWFCLSRFGCMPSTLNQNNKNKCLTRTYFVIMSFQQAGRSMIVVTHQSDCFILTHTKLGLVYV